MQILAHRGWWTDPAEKNSEVAFRRAFAAGFGIETDVRDQNGELKISHDMPVGDDLMTLSRLLEIWAEYPGAGTIALNIKADGLQAGVVAAFAAQPAPVFCFDMAVPDALGYLRQSFPTYTRHSEIEPVPAFYDQAEGVWVDAFFGDWITADVVEQHRAAGKKVALVSPELHRRDPAPAWAAWRELSGADIAICTDFPDRAQAFWASR